MKKFVAFIFVLFLSAVVPLQSSAERFTSGTSDDDVYYFPQELSEWCELDCKDKITETVIENCLIKICSDYDAADFTKKRVNKERFQKLLLQVWARAMVFSIEAKKKYANDEKFDKAENLLDTGGTDVRTQMSANTEIGQDVSVMKIDLNQLKQALAELHFFSLLDTNCKYFSAEEGDDE